MGYTYVMSKAEMMDSRACLQALLRNSTSMEIALKGCGCMRVYSGDQLDDVLSNDLPEANYEIEFFRECNDADYF